mgnify:FL=1|tara:strand:- start:241 stop:426 length:186 start_codon:yes stop_codon:yes gene_type:complete
MTRKHFKQLVNIIVDNDLNNKTVNDIISFCKLDNPRFCKETFRYAIDHKINQNELKELGEI